MLALLPILILLTGAMAVVIWQRIKPGFGGLWLLAVGIALSVWGLLIWLNFRLPVEFQQNAWAEFGELASVPHFRLDEVSWPYAFMLVSLVVAVLMTASARLSHQTNPVAWAGNLAITAAGLNAVLAASPLTLAAAWTAIDLIDLMIMLGMVNDPRLSQRVVISFAARVAGTWVMLWAVLQARASGVVLNFNQVPQQAAVYLLIAAGLRLGVLPLHLPYMSEIPMRRGVGTVLRLVIAASSLVLLVRLPADAIPPAWAPYLLSFTALAVVYAAFMWLVSPSELNGRPYWIIALAGFSVTAAIRGQPGGSLAWGLALLASGGTIFLFTARSRVILFLPVLGLLGFAALPFTPTNAGWSGIWAAPFTVLNLLFLLAHVVLMAGFLRHAFSAAGDDLSEMERWVQGLYPSGLVLLLGSQWFVAYLRVPGFLSFNLGSAIPAMIAVLLALGGLGLYARVGGVRLGWLAVIAGRVGGVLGRVLRLDWLYGLFNSAFGVGRRLIQFLTVILEGDGGVLWALLLLILLFSLLLTGGAS